MKAQPGRIQRGFNPTDVTAVRNGYWWTASGSTGFGTTGFRVIEQNGHATFDLIQATIANQPTLLTENGGTQFRCRRAADSNPTQLKTAAAVQAGWTGNTCIAGWFRLPDASGDTTGAGNMLAHTGSAAPLFRVTMTNVVSSGDKHACTSSVDGTATVSNQWGTVMAGAAWHWMVLIVTVGVSVELSSDGVQLTHTATAAPGATLNDSNATLSVACRGAGNLANVDTTDFATAFYCNGIPTAEELRLLAGVNNPAAVTW